MATLQVAPKRLFLYIQRQLESLIAAPTPGARKLAIISLASLALLSSAIAVLVLLIGAPIRVFDQILAALALTIVNYLFSRTRYYRLGILLAVVGAWVISVNVIMVYQSAAGLVIFFAPLLTFTLFFNARAILLGVAGMAVTLVIIYHTVPGDWEQAGIVIFFLILVGGTLALQTSLNQHATRTNQAFLHDMHALQTILMDLSRIEDLETLYRQMIMLPRGRLGFDRLALFLLDRDTSMLRGTYGIALDGSIRVETDYTEPITADHWSHEVAATPDRVIIRHDVPLRDNGAVVGTGWHASAALWDGEKVVGFLVGDCLNQGCAPRPHEAELLAVLGTQFGHLLHRQQMETALRHSETRYRAMVEAMPDMLFRIGADGTYRDYHTPDLNLLYVSPAQFLGRTIEEVLPPALAASRIAGINRALAERTLVVENFTLDLHGATRFFESRIVPVSAEEVLTIIRDITELAQAQEALHLSEARFRLALRESNIIVAEVDRDLRYTWVYNAHPDFDVAALIGKRDDEIIDHQPTADQLIALKQRVFATGAGARAEITFALSDGSHIYDIAAEPVYDESGTVSGVTTVAVDITERLQNQQREFDMALEQERMRLLTAFITHAAHEFRNPLAVIGTSAYLISRLDDPPARLDKVNRIHEQVRRISQLVDSLLLTVRLESNEALEQTPIDMVDLCATIRDATSFSDTGPPLNCDLPETLPPVLGDFEQLETAINHLLENAYRFTPPDGQITLAAGVSGDQVWVEVRDTGRGIAPEHHDRIFELFWRADQAHSTPGFGLGLPIARKIIHMHGGDISLTSKPDTGSTFRLILPAAGTDH